MPITFNRLEISDWKVDRNVLNPNINPEIDFFELTINESIGNQPIVDHPQKQTAQFIFFAIRWMYEIENAATKKQILFYDAFIWYSSDIETFKNKDELLKTIKDSFQRFSDEYDIKKKDLGVRKKCVAPDEFEYLQTLVSLMKT